MSANTWLVAFQHIFSVPNFRQDIKDYLKEQSYIDELDPLEYIDFSCHNTPRDSTSDKCVIKIPIFGSGTPEEWIIFMDFVQKSLVGQNITTGPPMYKF